MPLTIGTLQMIQTNQKELESPLGQATQNQLVVSVNNFLKATRTRNFLELATVTLRSLAANQIYYYAVNVTRSLEHAPTDRKHLVPIAIDTLKNVSMINFKIQALLVPTEVRFTCPHRGRYIVIKNTVAQVLLPNRCVAIKIIKCEKVGQRNTRKLPVTKNAIETNTQSRTTTVPTVCSVIEMVMSFNVNIAIFRMRVI